MQWFQKSKMDEPDEHNEPTEPLPDLDAIPTEPIPHDQALPTPQASEQPFPYRHIEPTPVQPASYSPPSQPYSPVPSTSQQAPLSPTGEKLQPTQPASADNPAPKQRRLLPLLPGLFFICVQLLLLLRFLLKIIGLLGDQAWVSTIYGISELFVLPFRALWQQVPLQLPSQIELYTLLAVIVYGLLSRLLVRLLKLILKSR